MSTIDLERLIVRRTYFVPLSVSEIKTRIFNELTKDLTTVEGMKKWYQNEVGNYVRYRINYRYTAARTYLVNEGLLGKPRKKYLDKLKGFLRGFDKELPESAFEEIERKRGSMPDDLNVIIKKIEGEESGCQCKVECLPVLYRQLSQRVSEETPNEFVIQDAFLTCGRFVENIFEGGLSAVLISEKKKELLKETTQLLVSDQASRQILDKIKEMLDQATGEILLCGWIGTLLLPKLKEINKKGVNIRVVTHKAKELKGKPGHQDVQRAFKELISMIGEDNLSIRPECHCRVVVVDNKALIGSMDLNAISLTGSHRELAIYTEDPEIVRNLRKYFNGIFSPLSKEKAK